MNNPNLPCRKPNRLKLYNYSDNGAYFITICVKDRCQILSQITVGDGVPDVPQNTLTKYGKIVEKYLNQMSIFYNDINVDKYVIMPNHIHFILFVSNYQNHHDDGTSRTPSPTNSTVAKFISTLKRFCNKEFGENIWQRSSHDHIIRNDKDYSAIWEYIDTNVLRWEKDCFYDN